MLGQNKIKEIKNNIIKSKIIPPLFVIIGNSKSGKTTAAQYIAEGLGEFVRCGNKVEEVREVIDTAYKQIEPVFYFFSNVQTMSTAALNALLKIAEEPPFKAHFILTVNAEENCLPTLISRSMKINIEPYILDELKDYAKNNKLDFDIKYADVISTPGLIKLTNDFDVDEMITGIKQFLVCPKYSSAAKLNSKVKTKDEDEGWDLTLFIDFLYKFGIETQYNKIVSNLDYIKELKYYLKSASCNKKLLLDSFLFLFVREE